MKPRLSLYVELLRLSAAAGVFLFHAGRFLLPWLPTTWIDHGAECVAVFFVISGFVIRHVSVSREVGAAAYASARLARLYSVTLVALVVTLAADGVGRHVNPDAYLGQRWFNPNVDLSDLLAYLTFTNEAWLSHGIFGSDEPYWSLGFEAPYYLAFGLAAYLRGRSRYVALAVWALVVGPKILIYLPLWLVGVATRDILARRAAARSAPRPWLGGLVVVASFAAYLVLKYGAVGHGRWAMFAAPSVLDLVCGATYFLTVGLIVAANLLGFDLAAGDGPVRARRSAAAIRWLAGGSFTLYLVHEPLLALVRAMDPGVVRNPVEGLLAVALILAASFALAEIGERRKVLFRRVTDQVIASLGAVVIEIAGSDRVLRR